MKNFLYRKMSFFTVIFLFLVSTGIAQQGGLGANNDSVLLDAYRNVELALAEDQFELAVSDAFSLVKISRDWLSQAGTGHPQEEHVRTILKGSESLSQAKETAEYWVAFSSISQGMVEFIRLDVLLQADWQLYFCSMFSGYGYWVQTKTDPKKMNPYMGLSMQQCGVKKTWGKEKV